MEPKVRVRRLSVPALVIWLISVLLTAGAVVILATIIGDPDALAAAGGVDVYVVTFLILAPVYASVGALIVSRGSGRRVGWIISAIGLLLAVEDFTGGYGSFANGPSGNLLPARIWIDWIGSWIWVPAVVGALVLLPIYFPDGRLPSRRWRPIVWAVWILAGLGFVGYVFTPNIPKASASGPTNPVGLAILAPLTEAIATIFRLTLIGGAITGAASLVTRYRHGSSDERQQVKWFAGAFGLVALLIAAYAVIPDVLGITPPDWLIGAIVCAGLTVVPVAVAIAVTKYRLYDIDVLINRTLVYGAVSAVLGATYFIAVVVFGALLRPFTAGSELAVALSTLASLALFQPLRRRIQRAVDRRFYRSRYDASRTLDAFSVRLRDEVDLDAVRADLIDAVASTVQPAHASVWLRR